MEQIGHRIGGKVSPGESGRRRGPVFNPATGEEPPWSALPLSYCSFGGWKSSLFGDSHSYGPEGVQFNTERKVVTARWPDLSTSQMDLGFPRTR